MSLTLDELTTPLTRQDVEASIYSVLAGLGVNTTAWKSGSVVRTMIVGVSVVLSAFSRLQALIARSGFLELSADDWLTLVAHYVYDVDRIAATYAAGQVTLVNAAGGVYTLSPGDLIVSNPATGQTYRNTAGFSLGANATLTIPVQADQAGSLGSAGPATITSFVTPLSAVAVSNALSLVGVDSETDPLLRARCSEKLGSLSPMGPWDAYTFAARNAVRADGSNAGVTRTRLNKDGFGNVTTYIANATGSVTGTAGDLSSDLGVVDEAIQQLAAPLAVTATTISATAKSLGVTAEVWMENTSGLTDAQVQALILARILVFVSMQPIGGHIIDPAPGKVFLDAVTSAIENMLPQIFHVEVSITGADVDGNLVLALSEVAVLGTLVLTIHQGPPPEGHL